jgi:L-lactate dehydrogenase complex protein LldG
VDEASFIARFRRERADPAPHPGAYAVSGYTASVDAFSTALKAVGGTAHAPVARAQLRETVSAAMAFGSYKRVVAAANAAALLGPMDGVAVATAPGDTRQWADVDLAIIAPELGVSENAAMLVSAASLPERGLAFIAQHVLALLDASTLVPDLHAAYAAMAHGRSSAALPHHLTFISGPSKTADIEQCLVIGAHGCRSLVVVPYLP